MSARSMRFFASTRAPSEATSSRRMAAPHWLLLTGQLALALQGLHGRTPHSQKGSKFNDPLEPALTNKSCGLGRLSHPELTRTILMARTKAWLGAVISCR